MKKRMRRMWYFLEGRQHAAQGPGQQGRQVQHKWGQQARRGGKRQLPRQPLQATAVRCGLWEA